MLLRRPFLLTARPRARVEIIPLIDVIFFLLATFVLFTLSLNRIKALDVVLPRAGSEAGAESASIVVAEGGVVLWNGGEVSLAELPVLLQRYKTQAEAPRVLVTGERRAKFGQLAAVLDAVRAAEIRQYSVTTVPQR